ncbi:MAG: protease inhibitor I42 family protein [Bacteroidales bacterium]
MKPRILQFVFIVFLISPSCASIEFDREYKLNQGEQFVINLKTNPSTGYTWKVEEGLSDSVVTLQKEKYVPVENPSGNPRLGGGGKRKWYFLADKKGNTILKFVYKRPGTEETSKEKYFQVRVE